MARYDYRLSCGHTVEVAHPMTEPAHEWVYCPRCGYNYQAQRIITEMPGVSLKGYGFYKKDNLPGHEKYAYDHFDLSGDNSEKMNRQRRVKDPETM